VGAKWIQIVEKVTVQKTYKRSGIVGILGILGIRKTNNLRIINSLVGFDPDQVHHLNLPNINPSNVECVLISQS